MNITLDAEKWEPPCLQKDGEPVTMGLVPISFGEYTKPIGEVPKTAADITEDHKSTVMNHVESVIGLSVKGNVITDGKTLVDSLPSWPSRLWLRFIKELFAELNKRALPDAEQEKN